MRKSVLDTDTLSYVLTGNYPDVATAARQYLRVFRYLTVSSMTIAEVVKGYAHKGDEAKIASFLEKANAFEILPIEAEEAELAGRILGTLSRDGNQVGPMDPFIAAVAIVNDRPLVTNNLKDYQRIVDAGFSLQLDNWHG